MIKNVIDRRGFVSEGTSGAPVLVIPSMSNTMSGTLRIDDAGTVCCCEISCLCKHEYYQHSPGAQFLSGSEYTRVYVDGNYVTERHGLSLWDPTTSVFRPTKCGVYTVQFKAYIEGVEGMPTLQLDFVLSGSQPRNLVNFKNFHCHEQVLRNTDPDIHLSTNFVVVVDQELITSGGIILGSTTGPRISLHSASLTITET